MPVLVPKLPGPGPVPVPLVLEVIVFQYALLVSFRNCSENDYICKNTSATISEVCSGEYIKVPLTCL